VFGDQFVDAANGDYTVPSGSPLKGAAPDGTDIGVNSAERARRLAGVDGNLPPAPRPPTSIHILQ
jgi:hypothetical protein